jgi:hypothetical protein
MQTINTIFVLSKIKYMTVKRFGKPSSSLLNQKVSFFEENEHFVKNQQKIGTVYVQQPKRTCCKNCATPFGSESDFLKDNINYILCEKCNHLNGLHEDTTEFCEALYTKDTGKEYAKNYNSDSVNDYNYRTSSIYLPKAEFLYTTLVSSNVNPNHLNYLDLGAGSGYFVAALKKMGLENVRGSEVSKTQVALGNAMIGEEVIDVHEMDKTNEVLRNTKSEVVSMIGVLEHLQYPREALAEISKNKNIKYLYISVPTFSLSVFLELLSPNVFHRQLSCGHTHLYTDKSLQYMAEEFGFKSLGEWWFGTDIVDLFRHVRVALEQSKSAENIISSWSENFIPLIDAMQLELDKKQMSSEVHLLLERK